jgi:DNA-binding transcriptional MerR regulator
MQENVTVEKAARICKVSQPTIRNWIKAGIISNSFKATIKGKNRVFIPYLDLPAFYRKQYEKLHKKAEL